MAEVAQRTKFDNGGKRNKFGKKKGGGPNKKQKFVDSKAKHDKNMQKLFAKRAQEYNSDDDEEDELKEVAELENVQGNENDSDIELSNEDEEDKDDSLADGKKKDEGSDEDADEEDDDEDTLPGAKFEKGIRAFKVAFKKIVKLTGDEDDLLGPVLTAQKKLLAEKLAEEVSEKKVNKEAKKEKLLVKERGHVKDLTNADVAHEKLLLGVATKGVVKLFNAVNKAQNAQRGLNPSRSKDEKVIKKRRKEAFFSELGKKSSESSGKFVKGSTSGGNVDDEGPAWAPLRDNYMLTNPKLKDWDKMQDTNDEDDFGRQSDADSSSGED